MKICTAGAMRGWAGLDVSSLDAIDVHTHVHRSVSAPASAPAGEPLAAMATYFKTGPAAYTVDELASYYRDRNMAAVTFTVDVAGEPEDPARPTNEEIAERARANADVIIPFASVDPARGRAGVRIAQRLIEEHGVRGFKFHPSSQGFRPNDRAAYPLYEVIEAAGLPALFHTGQTGVGAGRPGGGGIRLGYANTVLRHKMLFGTHFPMLTPERWRSDLDKTAIRDEVKPDLYKNNAARLLGLD
jgi:uncharacterized protein